MLLQPFFLSRHCCLSRARQQRNCSFLFREREKKLSAAVQSARKDRKRAARAEKEAVECFLFPAQQSHFAAAASSVGPKRPAPQGKKSACLPLLPRPFLSRNRNPTAPVRKDASNGPIQEKRLSKFVHTQQSSRVPILQKKKKKKTSSTPNQQRSRSKAKRKKKQNHGVYPHGRALRPPRRRGGPGTCEFWRFWRTNTERERLLTERERG